MPKTELTIKTYSVLLSQLRKVFIEGLQRIEEEKVKTYWRTGELISNYILENKERADYGDNLFERLSEDMEIDRITLQRAVKFYRAFPICSAQNKLSWMHFRQLITIEDKSKRELFAERAAKKGWGYRELEEAIRLDKLKIQEPKEKPKSSSVKLNVTRSRLFTYQILDPAYIHSETEEKVLDLGFSNNIQAEIFGVANLKSGEIIETQKTGSKYSFSRSDSKPKELYAYKALVERVVDADTIWLNIDCGFKVWTRQKVRLRGIDAPEIDTKKGQEAKELVEAKLKEVPFVVIKTHKSDKYDRYLADIFYPPLNRRRTSPPLKLRRASLKDQDDPQAVLEQGTFLNQELLDLGFAEKM